MLSMTNRQNLITVYRHKVSLDFIHYFILFISFFSDCTDGWQYFSGSNSCYKLIKSTKTWNAARSSCKAENADLASIPDEVTNSFLANLTSSVNWSICWIGGYRAVDDSNLWNWSDGTPWRYSNWWPGEPNNIHLWQDRVTLNYIWQHGGDGRKYANNDGIGWWDDQTSSFLASFICQRKLNTGKQTNKHDKSESESSFSE